METNLEWYFHPKRKKTKKNENKEREWQLKGYKQTKSSYFFPLIIKIDGEQPDPSLTSGDH